MTTVAPASLSPASALAANADVVYFFMFDGWKEEMRSNRWHYASRFARHLPVVLVQPSIWSDHEATTTEPESRIPNCRILRVRSTVPLAATVSGAFIQTRQIYQDMREHGYKRPIFWTYSPDYVLANGLLPAPLRVYHATENYFHFDKVTSGFHERLKALLSFTDVAICVSEGVAVSHRPYTPNGVEVVTNGCDYAHYATGKADAEIAALRGGYRKLAVYAGNVNGRIDFSLLLDSIRQSRDTVFAIVGPVSGLSDSETSVWRSTLEEANVRRFPQVPVERLPDIFRAADVGLIPYKNTASLTDNLFPLKAFEMLATGLPVVSTPLRYLEPYTGAGLRIASNPQEFSAGIGALSRSALTKPERAAIERSAQEQDYEKKFDRVCDILVARLKDSRPTGPGWALCGLSDDVTEMDIDRAIGKLLAPTVRISDLVRSNISSRLAPYRERVALMLSEDMRKRARALWRRLID